MSATARTLAGFVLSALGPGIAGAGTMATGDSAAPLSFTDIDGLSSSTDDFGDWVQVWTVGDRGSAERLTAWMGAAGVRAMAEHPEQRFAFLGFADVSEVPPMFQPVALPIMRHIHDRAKDDLLAAYAERGLELSPERARFHLTADWEGDFLDAVGLSDARRYHCWIVHRGRVVAHLVEGTPDIAARFADAVDGLDLDASAEALP